MKPVCHSLLSPISHEGFSSKALMLLTGGNRKFPHVLDFTTPDVAEIQIASADHMSISGLQDKISLILRRGKLMPAEARGTYLLKPIPSAPIPRFKSDVPANEHVTMQIARQIFGMQTAANALVFLKDGEPAYITKRFDYRNGRKIAQEDFCQLAGISEETHGKHYKYEGSYEMAGRLLRKYGPAYPVEVEKLYTRILFNYIFSNGDAHLKNFSLFESDLGDYIMTPAYDLLCTSMHFPDESRTALELFDRYESDYFKANGFYGLEDFLKLAEIYGMPESRSQHIVGSFRESANAVNALVSRSFLSAEAQDDYVERFRDRLRTLAPR